MAVPIVSSPDSTYATKPNILYPGTQTQATAAETRADTVVDQRLASSGIDAVSVNIGAGSIEIET